DAPVPGRAAGACDFAARRSRIEGSGLAPRGDVMEQPSPAGEAESESPTPEILLDALRAHPEWAADERDVPLDRLITGFPSARLLASIRARLGDLGGSDGEVMLRILEAYGSPDDLRALADALRNQPDLAAARAWEALTLLADGGLLEEYPELSERW